MNAPPPKLFREEAKTGAIDCPACGAPITLRAFGAVQEIACAYCGTVVTPEDDGNLEILQRAERARRESVLPLHKRGTLDGETWEIIGITWREIVAYGDRYPWQEFLLFNPYRGYRWLIYSMTDGQWSVGGALPGAAKLVPAAHPQAEYAGERYKHFTSGEARTTYVEGEFPWQVRAGDTAQTNDYVCPPKMISVEVQQTEEGSDINFTQVEPIAPEAVWKAFEMPGSPPPAEGVHPAAVNPHASKFYLIAGALLFLAWVGAVVSYAMARDGEQIYSGSLQDGQVLRTPVTIGEPGEETTLKFELQAQGMNNSWAEAEILLVDEAEEQAIGFVMGVDMWSGVEGGEAWSEGNNPRKGIIGGVEGGNYVLQVTPTIDRSGDPADRLQLSIKEDVTLARYMFLPLLVIILFPIVNFLRKNAFEHKRWSNSDHASWEE